MTIRAVIMTMFSSQPVFSIAQENIDDDTEATESGLVTPQMMKARMRVAVMPKTILSRPNLLRCSSMLIPGTRPGCMSSG